MVLQPLPPQCWEGCARGNAEMQCAMSPAPQHTQTRHPRLTYPLPFSLIDHPGENAHCLLSSFSHLLRLLHIFSLILAVPFWNPNLVENFRLNQKENSRLEVFRVILLTRPDQSACSEMILKQKKRFMKNTVAAVKQRLGQYP